METSKVVEIAKDIYWVGAHNQEGPINCNPYLIIDGEEGVLIDPGSVIDFDYVYENISSIIAIKKIKYVILHNQNPKLASCLPLFEKKGCEFKIVTHSKTQMEVKYYGLKSKYYIVDKNEFRLVLKSGRVIGFLQTPYLNCPGAIATYDYKSKILFSGYLFGGFSYKWSIYAIEDYIENMKTFHENFMPSNQLLRAVMEELFHINISMIAPYQGSIIKDNIKKYIKILRDLECGPLITPIKKDFEKDGGYIAICSSVLKRYAAIFNKAEVREVIEDLDITLNDDMGIEDYNYKGKQLWNLIFERALEKKGEEWIIVLKPLLQTLSKKYNIPLPKVFETNLKKGENEVTRLKSENEMLNEINARCEIIINESVDKLISCPLTGLYNYDIFKNFISKEITQIINEGSEQNPGLVVISLDHLGKITDRYGENILEELLKSTVEIVESIKIDGEILFRLQGTLLLCFIPHTNKEKLINYAEEIRILIESLKKLELIITASIGVACLDEVRADKFRINNLDETLYNIVIMRVKIAKSTGKNKVCSESNVIDYKGEVGNILLVDTDAINIDVLKMFLENLSFKVYTAGDGEEALNLVEKNQIDLIVSEIMLPKIDGFHFREKLLTQEHNKNIPFIIVSLLKDDDSVKRAAKLGIEHYFRKPFMLSEFIEVVKIKMKVGLYQ